MDLSTLGGGGGGGGDHHMPIPMPLNSKYMNGPPAPSSTEQPHHHHHHHQSLSYTLGSMNLNLKKVRYRECLKNHAASIGGNATDGCGEFMPSGEEGSMEALKCSACNCHRNFHRKEMEGDSNSNSNSNPPPYDHHHQQFHPSFYHQFRNSSNSRNKVIGNKGVLVTDPLGYNAGGPQPILPLPSPHHHMVMPLGALQQSESDEINEGIGSRPMSKKRFRTKFTQEQKEKMLGFAERVGWRLQRQEEGEVQRFCQEIGVKRRVLKVWMHNNKHNLSKKGTLNLAGCNSSGSNNDNHNNNSNGNGNGHGHDVVVQLQQHVQVPPHISMQVADAS